MKRIISVVIAVLLLTSLFAGCGAAKNEPAKTEATAAATQGQAETTAQEVKESTIKIASALVREREQFDEFLAKFQEQNPNIKIDVEYLTNEQYETILKAKFAANDAPDTMGVWNIPQYVKAGYFMDITDFPALQKLDPSIKMYIYDGKRFAMPMGMAAQGLFSNNTVLKDIGVSIPTNFDELLAASEKAKAKGYIPIAFGDKDSVSSQIHGGWAAEITMTEEEGKGLPAGTVKPSQNKGIINSFTKTKILMDKGYFSPGFQGLTYDQAMVEFATNKAAFHFSAEWIIGNLKSINKDVDFSISPYPYNDEGLPRAMQNIPYGFAVNAKTQVKDAVSKLFDAFTTQMYADIMGTEFSLPFSGIEQRTGKEDLEYNKNYADRFSPVYYQVFDWSDWLQTSAKNTQDFLSGTPLDKVMANLDAEMEKSRVK